MGEVLKVDKKLFILQFIAYDVITLLIFNCCETDPRIFNNKRISIKIINNKL